MHLADRDLIGPRLAERVGGLEQVDDRLATGLIEILVPSIVGRGFPVTIASRAWTRG